MKEHPILFNTEMVKAVLDGRKTQTRRVIKAKRGFFVPDFSGGPDEDYESPWPVDEATDDWMICPYGMKGDYLWVRERFCYGEIVAGDSLPEEEDPWYIEQCKNDNAVIFYENAIREDIGMEDVKWKPSIHMPRWASRVNLEITDIRVERVMDITVEDALSEGVETWVEKHQPNGDKRSIYPTADFAQLWDSINEKRGFGWDVNPWVWVVEFKVI